jgi:hypothetical protein
MSRVLSVLRLHIVVLATTTPLLFAVSNPDSAPAPSSDVSVNLPPPANLAVTAFRLVLPVPEPTAIVVLLPGSNSDGRGLVEQEAWRSWAVEHRVALVGCYFKDEAHADDWIERYADASHGSGQALLDALTRLASAVGKPEIAGLPLALVGDSAGGQFAYEFTCWRPERVLAFVAHKGGVYFTHLAPATARQVPGLFFIGGHDLTYRRLSLMGIWAMGRRADALWALVDEPDSGHEAVNLGPLSRVFLADALNQRLAHGQFQPAQSQAGWLISSRLPIPSPSSQISPETDPTGWLPGSASAQAAQPFAPRF